MEFRQLGKTDIKVSVICLGTMTWGEQNTEADAHAQLDFAVDHDVNFIDTAELYPVTPRAETQGLTETYIGTWLAKNPEKRSKVVLATKVCGKEVRLSWIRGGEHRLDKANIEAAVDSSLKRLQTDYIDLYQLHWPDREVNNFGMLSYTHAMPNDGAASFEETLEALQSLVQKGKIRQIGLSNETPWGTMNYLKLAETKGYPRVVSIQNPYSLLNRTYEIGLSEISIEEECGLLAYSPLGFGVLTGKYQHGAKPPGARLTEYERFNRYSTPQAAIPTERYIQLAKQHGLSPTHLALAFVNGREFVTSNIIGATNLDQLKENIESANVKLSDAILHDIDAIHNDHPNPCP